MSSSFLHFTYVFTDIVKGNAHHLLTEVQLNDSFSIGPVLVYHCSKLEGGREREGREEGRGKGRGREKGGRNTMYALHHPEWTD